MACGHALGRTSVPGNNKVADIVRHHAPTLPIQTLYSCISPQSMNTAQFKAELEADRVSRLPPDPDLAAPLKLMAQVQGFPLSLSAVFLPPTG